MIGSGPLHAGLGSLTPRERGLGDAPPRTYSALGRRADKTCARPCAGSPRLQSPRRELRRPGTFPTNREARLRCDDDLYHEIDEDPADAESPPFTVTSFEVRRPGQPTLRGTTKTPHFALAPGYVRVWKDAAGKRLACVAATVEGANGPQLVVLDETRVEVTPLSTEEEIDQRRVAVLRDFVPSRTPPADVEPLLAERRRALAAPPTERVRYMEPAAASSAHLACTPP